MEESDLYEELRDVQATIAEWRAKDVFDGDQGFQRLLQKESDLLEQIAELNED